MKTKNGATLECDGVVTIIRCRKVFFFRFITSIRRKKIVRKPAGRRRRRALSRCPFRAHNEREMRFRRLISRVRSPAAAPVVVVVVDIRRQFKIYTCAYTRLIQLQYSISGPSEESGNLHSLIKRPHAEACTTAAIYT